MLLGFWFYFAAQRQCSFASAERLLCKSFLYCNRTCNAFIEPKKHLCRCFWVFGSTLLRKDNARSQVRNDYFVSPSCTATAHATDFSHQKRHFVSAFCDTGAFCYAKQSSVALRNPIILSNLLVPRLRKQRLHQPWGCCPYR